jgi:tetratricopeptide (TPR) repeat protein
LTINPDSAECNYNLASAYLDVGDKDLALVHFIKSVNIDPMNPDTHLNIGNLYEGKNCNFEALTEYKEVLKLDKENKKASQGLQRLS